MRAKIPIKIGDLEAHAAAGLRIEHVVIQKQQKGYVVTVEMAGRNECYVIERQRGGVRVWNNLDRLVALLEELLPNIERIEISLRSSGHSPSPQ